jgi:hypothetical protein
MGGSMASTPKYPSLVCGVTTHRRLYQMRYTLIGGSARLVLKPMAGAAIWDRKREFNPGLVSGRRAKLYVTV